MTDVSSRLAEMGLTLPDPVPRKGRFRAVVVRGDLAFTSGAFATETEPLRIAFPGKVGGDVSLEDARQSARRAVLATLANLIEALGTLDRVESFVHITGYVNAVPEFDKVHHVIGAATDLVGELFGDEALAARTAIGVSTLPEQASVVLDAVVAIRP